MTKSGKTNQQPVFKPNPALKQLNALVGEWEMTSSLYPGSGDVTFEWLEGGAYLLENVLLENMDSKATWMIGRDESVETYCMLYFDSRGVSRTYEMSLNEDVWKIWRNAPGFSQRFTGTFSKDGDMITADWEKSFDGTNWEHDFDLTYTKIR